MNKILYNPDDFFDSASVLAFIHDFTIGIGLTNVQIDTRAIEALVAGMKFDFPHVDGEEKASPFKKAANFLCFFVSEKPILDSFPQDKIGLQLSKLSNHQNAIVGFMFICKALHGATLQRKNQVISLKNPIKVSRHSLEDIVDALTTISAQTSFKLVSVFLEQLVYKTNPDCQYQCVQVAAECIS